MNRWNIVALLLVAMVGAGFFMLSPTHAQPAVSGRNNVAIVNVPVVFRSAKETVSMNKDLEEQTKKIEADMKSRSERLKQMEEDIRKNFEGPDLKDRMRDLLTERIRMRVEIEERQRDIMMQQQMRAENFYAKINKVIEGIALAEGYDLVLFNEDFSVRQAQSPEQLLEIIRQRKVLFSSQRADITKQVIDKLDVEFAAPAGKN